MKRLLLFLLFMVNLQIVIQKDGIAMTLFSETYAQHMDLEGGNYDCFDEVKGWFKSPFPCDGVIITPDEDYVECPWCYQEFSTSEFADHENICPQRPGAGEDDPFHSDSENNGDIGGGGYGGFGGGTSTGGSSGNSGSGTGGNWPSTLYIPKPGETMIPNYKIPTLWKPQNNDYNCVLFSMEYIYNIQRFSPDYNNNYLINSTSYARISEYYLQRYWQDLTINKRKRFNGVNKSLLIDLLSYENFKFTEINYNEIPNYIDSQYLVLLAYRLYNSLGAYVNNHAVVVVGYDDHNNLIVIDPIIGRIVKKENDGDFLIAIAISPYRAITNFDTKKRTTFDYE